MPITVQEGEFIRAHGMDEFTQCFKSLKPNVFDWHRSPMPLPESSAVGEPPPYLVCDAHGRTPACFICTHLADGTGKGFFHGFDLAALRPGAWCGVCEKAWQKAGGWTDESEAVAQIKVRCAGCYDDIRTRDAVG
jgi:hypothetical protein